jgi:hypothetical protein
MAQGEPMAVGGLSGAMPRKAFRTTKKAGETKK